MWSRIRHWYERWLSGQPALANTNGGEEDFLLVSWDSCRYDAYLRARTPVLDAHAAPRRAWAMATYTLPAHVAMFQGFLPNADCPEPYYNRFRRQLWRISHRNLHQAPLVTFQKPTSSIPAGFRNRGYFTAGTAAMDWFRDAPVLQDGFEWFNVPGTGARRQNDELIAAIERRSNGRPCFAFVNYGETHSPFRHEGMPTEKTAVDERFRRRRLYNQSGVTSEEWTFDEEAFARQVACAEFLDARTGELVEALRQRGRPTTVVVCADHGECFGENGLWGHALYHEKVMEVPLLIFRVNAPAWDEDGSEASQSASATGIAIGSGPRDDHSRSVTSP